MANKENEISYAAPNLDNDLAGSFSLCQPTSSALHCLTNVPLTEKTKSFDLVKNMKQDHTNLPNNNKKIMVIEDIRLTFFNSDKINTHSLNDQSSVSQSDVTEHIIPNTSHEFLIPSAACLYLNPETGYFENVPNEEAQEEHFDNISSIKDRRKLNHNLRLHGKPYEGMKKVNGTYIIIAKYSR